MPYALSYFNLEKNDPKILHIAPNKNEFFYIKNRITPLSNYDRLNIRDVKYINIVQDLTQTNLESNQYDIAIAWHVLEHIPEDIKAISEVHRLLKPGGCFLVSVPIYPVGNLKTYEDIELPYEEFEKIHGHYDHCRSCGLDYYKRFEALGFKTQTLKVKNLRTNKIDLLGLSGNHVVWCFIK
jgi:SAM-dependent methyltransferase